jgi:4-hydroxybenzoate polyprenyltransferase
LFSTSVVGRNPGSAEGISQASGSKHSHHPTDTGTSLKSTLPSSAEPIRLDHAFEKLEKEQKESIEDGDSGYLAFTKASLFKLTLPLFPPDKKSDPTSSTSKASSPLSKSLMAKAVKDSDREGDINAESENESGPMSAEPWEHRVDRGEQISQVNSPDSSSDVKRKGKSGHPVAAKKGDLHGPENGEPSDDQSLEFDSRAPAKSVVFLLHSGQPLR